MERSLAHLEHHVRVLDSPAGAEVEDVAVAMIDVIDIVVQMSVELSNLRAAIHAGEPDAT